MRSRIFLKLLAVLALVIVTATITLDITVRHSWGRMLREQIERNLVQKAKMLANRVETDRTHNLQDIASQEALAAEARVTIIDPTGKVLADSEADPATMQNHAQRKEFVAALAGNLGKEERRSQTLGVPFIYVAVPVSGGAVRLAYPLAELESSRWEVGRALFWGTALAFLLALLLAAIAANSMARRLRRIVTFAEQVAAGDLTARIGSDSIDEIGQVASALDRTARRLEDSFASLQHSQRQLETLLNSMQDAVIAITSDSRVQWANRGLDRLVPQHVRLQEPVVKSVRDPDFLSALQQANEEKRFASARAHSILPGRTYDVTAAPLPGGGAVAVLRDLTETERVEKTRRDFIANVSHELRTPLTSIQGYAETILDGSSESSHTREFLEIIRKNAFRMARLTEDLLTLARVESGEQRFDVETVQASELLSDARESFQEVAKTGNVELIVEDTASSAGVQADREAVHQVFSNLIENALKYGGSGGKVILGSRRINQHVEFSVKDFGPGIPSEHLPRLFERFYRVDKARSRESGGTGLGLAIAKHIVLAHGGSIRAESELNHGSTFVFSLPAA